MWKFLKNVFLLDDTNSKTMSDSTSIQKLVTFNSLNKRKNARVKYPHFGGTGPFPRVFYSETEMIVANISVGGILIIDDTEAFGTEVGEIVNLEFKWDDGFNSKIRARVVGANLQRRHLQFVDFNAPVFLKISELVKPGYMGSRFHLVHDDSGNLQALELWIGPTGENLSFFASQKFAIFTMNQMRLTFNSQKHSVLLDDQEHAPHSLLTEALVIIANFPETTPNTKKLMELIDLIINRKEIRKKAAHG